MKSAPMANQKIHSTFALSFVKTCRANFMVCQRSGRYLIQSLHINNCTRENTEKRHILLQFYNINIVVIVSYKYLGQEKMKGSQVPSV